MRNDVKLTHVKRPYIRHPYQAERSYYEVHQGDLRRGEVEYKKGHGWVVIPDASIGFARTKLLDGEKLQHAGSTHQYFDSKDEAAQRLVTWCELTDEERHADFDLRARRDEARRLKERMHRAWGNYEDTAKLVNVMYRPKAKLAMEQATAAAKVLFVTTWNAYRAAIPVEDAEQTDHIKALTLAKAEVLGIDMLAEIAQLKQQTGA